MDVEGIDPPPLWIGFGTQLTRGGGGAEEREGGREGGREGDSWDAADAPTGLNYVLNR